MDTIKQKVVRVQISDDRSVEVRRLGWKDARAFIRAMSSIGLKITSLKKEELPALVSSVLAQSEEIATLLGTRSTGMTADEFDALDFLDALKVLEAAFELNYDAELKNFLAGIGGKLATLIPRGEAKMS